MTTICVMQPYLFPYLPYYQLAHAVDAFWVLDDVQFIRRGWMNRNTILLNGQRLQITFPVSKGNRSDLISEKELADDFDLKLSKIKSTLKHAYSGAPHCNDAVLLIERLASVRSTLFLDAALTSLKVSFSKLGIYTPLYLSSTLGLPQNALAQDRILSICEHTGATRYVNPVGGRMLYGSDVFSAKGIDLKFLQSNILDYPQIGRSAFEPGLSVLDLIANLDPLKYATQLNRFRLV